MRRRSQPSWTCWRGSNKQLLAICVAPMPRYVRLGVICGLRIVQKSTKLTRCAKASLRTLAALYVEFRGHPDATELEKDAGSMFERTNCHILEEAIRSLTVKEDAKVKYGLKNSVYYLLLKSAEILEGEALTVKGEAGK